MGPRHSDQILLDALVAEKARLSRRLQKLKAILDANPLEDLLQLHKQAAGLDLRSPGSHKQLAELAAKEQVLTGVIDRHYKRDRVKDITELTNLEVEISEIDTQIFFKRQFGRCK